jgi:predicted dehydrogenase
VDDGENETELSMAERSRVRVGLLGAGFLAQTRARCWRRVHGVDVQLTAVAARDSDRLHAFVKTLSGSAGDAIEVATEWRKVVERQDIDLIDVCLPNHLHRAAVEAAAGAGKPVLCTKPLAAYVGQDLEDGASDSDVATRDAATKAKVALADARAMLAACDQAGVPLMYGENWVFAPSIVRAAGLLARGRGVLLEMRGEEAHSGSHAGYARTWRHAGGGALLRLGSHPIGAMLHLKRLEGLRRGGTPVGVEAVTAELGDPLVAAPDDATALAAGARDTEPWGCAVLQFTDGTRGTVFGSDLALGGMTSQLELRASDARLLCRLSPHDDLSAFAAAGDSFGDSYLMEKLDGQAGWSTPLPDEDVSSGQQGLCQAVAEALSGGAALSSDGTLGLAVTEVLSAAYLSAEQGRRVGLDELR